jgi:tripartite-type tricarboxylate transporter receptor subunit TctC
MGNPRLMKWLAILVLAAGATAAAAQGFPRNQPITLVVPYPPGGLSDFLGRALAARLADSLAVSVVIENRAGANGAIGAASVARSRPDGHTIAVVPASTVTTNQWLMKDMPFDPIRDLTPLALTLVTPNVLVVHPSVPAKSVPELLELIRSRPGKLNYASVGMGSSGHLQGEMMSGMAKLKMVHVPYKGAGPAVQDLVAGQVQMMFDNLPAVLPQIQAGNLRALAVTSAAASPQMPDLPPMNRFLPGFESTPWFGIVGPAGIPRDVVAILNEHIVRAARSPEVVKAMEARGAQVVTSTAEELGKTIRDESERMRQVIRDANITLQ